METPTISKSIYASNTLSGNTLYAHDTASVSSTHTQAFDWHAGHQQAQKRNDAELRRLLGPADHPPKVRKEPLKMPSLRLVQVFIADTDANLPIEKRILFQSGEKMTDSTDQELFMEVWNANILTEHNALRVMTLDKKATAKAGKDVFLEPLRIRDLKMVVTDIASFE